MPGTRSNAGGVDTETLCREINRGTRGLPKRFGLTARALQPHGAVTFCASALLIVLYPGTLHKSLPVDLQSRYPAGGYCTPGGGGS
jgi:hypothetical protein